MHPLVARIHPSIRTAFFAWVVTRGLMWCATAAAGHSALVRPADGLAEGAPGWSALIHAADALDSLVAIGPVGGGSIALAVGAEIALLAGLVGVYRFVRRDHLPTTAERATWLWAAFPAMAATLPASDWSFAIAAVGICLGALSTSRHLLAFFAMAVAVAFKPEALLTWPGAALLGWKTYRAGKQHPVTPWLMTLGPPALFSATIVAGMTLAGRFGVSLRTLQSGSRWRSDFAFEGLEAHAVEISLAAVLLVGVWLVVAYLKRTEAVWPLIALPCLAWPLAQQPATAAAAAILFALPFFGYLARACDEATLERPLLAAFVGGLLVMMI